MKKNKNPVVISLGGSLIYPKKINVSYLEKFRDIILAHIKTSNQTVIIVTGGGKICREYNFAARALNPEASEDELDWMGIKCTKVNAELIRIMFNDKSYFKVLDHPFKRYQTTKKILISGGAKPGQSSDGVAVSLARSHGASVIINLTNITHVYSKDPKKYSDAKKIDRISWEDFRKIVGNTWNAGANFPFDPTASRRAAKYKLKVIIALGADFKNLVHILQGEKFQGTIIE